MAAACMASTDWEGACTTCGEEDVAHVCTGSNAFLNQDWEQVVGDAKARVVSEWLHVDKVWEVLGPFVELKCWS